MKSLIHFIELGLVLAILIAVGIPLFSRLPLRKIFEEPEKDTRLGFIVHSARYAPSIPREAQHADSRHGAS